jgi:ABC-type dipeptide/oligopeptide/nickel transport system permease subunit
VGAFNDNIPLWVIIGIVMGFAMGYIQGKIDPETKE